MPMLGVLRKAGCGVRREIWFRLFLYYAAGVLAAAQIGKLATLAPTMRADLGLGLATMAVLIALIEAGGALLGTRAGVLAQRLGLQRALLAALLLLAVASLGLASAQGLAALAAWRLVEAAGYLGVVVSAPVLIAAQAGPRRAPQLLAVWSSFVPVGLAVGAWGHSALAAVSSWRTAVLASSVAAALMLLTLWATRRWAEEAAQPAETSRPQRGADAGAALSPSAWALAMSFGGFALFGIGVLALLPSALVAQAGLGVADAGRWTALASFSTVAGSTLAVWAVHRPGLHRPLIATSLLLPAVLAFAVFGGTTNPLVMGSAAIVLNMVLGIYGGLAFAMLPAVAGGPERTAAAYGLLAQFGASGSLAGPPLMAWVVERRGWPAAAWLGLLVSLAAAWLALKALRGKAAVHNADIPRPCT